MAQNLIVAGSSEGSLDKPRQLRGLRLANQRTVGSRVDGTDRASAEAGDRPAANWRVVFRNAEVQGDHLQNGDFSFGSPRPIDMCQLRCYHRHRCRARRSRTQPLHNPTRHAGRCNSSRNSQPRINDDACTQCVGLSSNKFQLLPQIGNLVTEPGHLSVMHVIANVGLGVIVRLCLVLDVLKIITQLNGARKPLLLF